MDLFVAGPPCQPFSAQGQRAGADDARASLLFQVVLWICRKKPLTFCIEQVRGLQSQHPETLVYVLQTLAKVKDSAGQALYTVQYRLLNARVHSSLPQHRERLFIVGAQRAKMKRSSFQWPQEASSGQNMLLSPSRSMACDLR
mgnify:CR=1 FL=1